MGAEIHETGSSLLHVTISSKLPLPALSRSSVASLTSFATYEKDSQQEEGLLPLLSVSRNTYICLRRKGLFVTLPVRSAGNGLLPFLSIGIKEDFYHTCAE